MKKRHRPGAFHDLARYVLHFRGARRPDAMVTANESTNRNADASGSAEREAAPRQGIRGNETEKKNSQHHSLPKQIDS